jgi:hypothetical protein
MAGEILDVFHQDPFTAVALTDAVQRNPFQPVGLGSLNVFEPNPIRTKALAVESRTGKLVLIPFSERGSEGTQRTTEKRDMRYFEVPRLMHDDTIYAEEVQGIREFGTESVLMQVESEVARRLSGPTGLLASVEYTKEYLRLAALQGLVLDPKDGSIVYNWFNEFGITQAAPVVFDLVANTQYALRPICNSIIRTMARKAQGAFTATTRVYAMCGDRFYDLFVNHQDVIRTFVNWSEAADLRDSQGAAFDAFDFSGITWFNYRGSDDNQTIKVPDDEVLFFPVGAPGIFREANGPGETVDWVNTPGRPVYVLPIFDLYRRMWWKMETYAYPLFICTRPEVLLSGTALASVADTFAARDKAREEREKFDREQAKQALLEAASRRLGATRYAHQPDPALADDPVYGSQHAHPDDPAGIAGLAGQESRANPERSPSPADPAAAPGPADHSRFAPPANLTDATRTAGPVDPDHPDEPTDDTGPHDPDHPVDPADPTGFPALPGATGPTSSSGPTRSSGPNVPAAHPGPADPDDPADGPAGPAGRSGPSGHGSGKGKGSKS